MPWDGDRLPSARRYLKDRWLADELLYGIFVGSPAAVHEFGVGPSRLIAPPHELDR